MRTLISAIFICAFVQFSWAANIPPGYNCTSDLASICEGGNEGLSNAPAADTDTGTDTGTGDTD